ncbi:MAG: type II toxin-antitoxin system RelE/ParE family toxin [Tepidisphaeraceae bacterium]
MVLRLKAAQDLEEIVDYLRRESPAVALRFAESAETTFTKLAEFPGMGSPKDFRSVKLRGIRSWPITEFPNHLIFDRAQTEAIEVLAVLHGARRISRILRDRV